MKYIPTSVLLLILFLTGCDKPKEFTLIFTMESVNNYKISMELDKDKNYLIRQQFIFFDTYAGRERINTSEGRMTDEDYEQLSELVSSSRLFKMKDAYGFDREADEDSQHIDVIFQLIYAEGRKIKYISIRTNPADRFPESFLQLLTFLNNYVSDNFS